MKIEWKTCAKIAVSIFALFLAISDPLQYNFPKETKEVSP